MRGFEEILQEHWDDKEGEMTFDDILDAQSEFMSQYDPQEEILLGLVEDPFESPEYF